MTLKPGTKVLIPVAGAPEIGRILRWLKRNGPVKPDWRVVRFDSDGAVLLVRASGLEAVR
jgi:hypothetical protein